MAGGSQPVLPPFLFSKLRGVVIKMLYRRQHGMMWLYSPLWEEQGVKAVFSARYGGESVVPYQSLNLGLHVGDNLQTVRNNRQKWLAALRTSGQPCCAEQVHGTEVVSVDASQAGRGLFDYSDALPGIDGMLTDQPGLPLLTFYADCIPVYLFDPRQQVIGLVHSGWKGTVGRISARAVEKMVQDYGCKPANILAIIGPGIGRCCYEVDAAVAEPIRKEFTEVSQLLYPKIQEDRWDLDLKQAVHQTLVEAGLSDLSIEDTGICTCCRRDIYYSHRGEQGRCGRMGALIELG